MLFPELDKTQNIIILITFIVLAVYIVLVIFAFSMAFAFRSLMKRDNKGIRINLSSKLDLLKKMQEYLEKENIKLSEETCHTLRYLDVEDYLDAQGPNFKSSREKLTLAESEIDILIKSNEEIKNKDQFVLTTSLINDLNESLKLTEMAYNADVLGYNFWIRFGPSRYIFLLFRVKLKKNI